jgi:hypothetical protein
VFVLAGSSQTFLTCSLESCKVLFWIHCCLIFLCLICLALFHVSSKLIMYADDSTLYRLVNNFEHETNLQNDLNSILLWSVNIGISLKVNKCIFMDVT